MAAKRDDLHLTAAELAQAFAGSWAERYPPIMSVDQAAELLQVPRQTIYDWHSRGLLKGCCRRIGKYLRFFRDRLVRSALSKGITSNVS